MKSKQRRKVLSAPAATTSTTATKRRLSTLIAAPETVTTGRSRPRKSPRLPPPRVLPTRPLYNRKVPNLLEKHGNEEDEGQGNDDQDDSTSCEDPNLRQRGKRRTKKLSGTASDARSRHGSLLEDMAVKPTTQRLYEDASLQFLRWAKTNGFTMTSPHSLDAALCQYMTQAFLGGHQAHVGEKLVAGMIHVLPELGRAGALHLPRAWRAVKGWRRLCPGRSRHPLPLCVWSAVANHMISRGRVYEAIFVLLAFIGYLRPSEALNLRRAHLLPPVGPVSRFWSILVCPEEVGVPTKTGSMDDSLLLDHPRLLWMNPVWEELRRGDLNEFVLPLTYRQVVDSIAVSGHMLGLKLVPYQLRHSGASDDRLQKIRTSEEIMKRGRWRTLKSVARYEKHARVTLEFSRLTASVQAHCVACEGQLGDVFLGRVPPLLVPPRV